MSDEFDHEEDEEVVDLTTAEKEATVTEETETEDLLVPREQYLSAGVHIGTKLKNSHSGKWIYRNTPHGLYIINLMDTDDRIRIAARFLSSFDPSKITVCSLRRYGKQPINKFCEVIGATAFDERFVPGTLTNPRIAQYHECDVLIIIDPHADKQALNEAITARIPLISLIDTDDYVNNVDLAIPCNNRGKKSLSLIFYLLARQIQRERGEIPPDGDIKFSFEEFLSNIQRE